jgi:hypothetical protein
MSTLAEEAYCKAYCEAYCEAPHYETPCNSLSPVSKYSNHQILVLIVYEGASKIFRTGTAICTAVVVVQSTGR